MNPNPPYQRIATEEAWVTKEIVKRWRDLINRGEPADEPGFQALIGFFLNAEAPLLQWVVNRLQDLGGTRLADMDEVGINKQILSLTSPGVQVFEGDLATRLAAESNDEVASAIRANPDRYDGLAAVAPQQPANAAAELHRAVNRLGLKGVVINSHTKGEYLDDPKFWEIFEAAEALDVPIYLHPRTPSPQMLEPYMPALYGAVYGFAAETGLHLMRLIISGVFDRFPNLQIIAGHMAEGLPYWMYRLDVMHKGLVQGGAAKPLRQPVSQYLKTNIYTTNSGVAWEPVIRFVREVVGIDRLMYAQDYPYQYIPEEIDTLDNLPFSGEEMRQFYQTNAERVFKLNDKPA